MERIDYRQLKTLSDVKAARVRVDTQLERVEGRLKEDYRQAARLFDFDYLVEAASAKVASFCGVIEAVVSGYRMVSQWIGRLRSPRQEGPPQEERTTDE